MLIAVREKPMIVLLLARYGCEFHVLFVGGG